MIILDTNVLSAFMQAEPPEAVIAWLNRQPPTSIWTTTINVFEIEFGLRSLRRGKKRARLEEAFQLMLQDELNGRILSFDTPAALAAGALSAELKSQGFNVDIRDIQIAGIARARSATVCTRNVKHFDKACTVINPWSNA